MEKKEKKKTLGNLFKNCYGILEGDKEYDKIMKDVRKEWTRWTKNFEKQLKRENKKK